MNNVVLHPVNNVVLHPVNNVVLHPVNNVVNKVVQSGKQCCYDVVSQPSIPLQLVNIACSINIVFLQNDIMSVWQLETSTDRLKGMHRLMGLVSVEKPAFIKKVYRKI